LEARIGGPGQLDGHAENFTKAKGKFYLPLAGESCRIVLIYKGSKIVAIEPGSAFDKVEWAQVSEEIEKSLLTGPVKVGREYSFCSFRVVGSWRGDRSGVQILPPPDDAPRADVEMAEHPFILEFPIQASDFWPVTNHRRMREHRKLLCSSTFCFVVVYRYHRDNRATFGQRSLATGATSSTSGPSSSSSQNWGNLSSMKFRNPPPNGLRRWRPRSITR